MSKAENSFKKEQCCLPFGTMVCARGAAAKMILADINNPNINRDIISNVTSVERSYYGGIFSPLGLVDRPLSTMYIPQINKFKSAYAFMEKYIMEPDQAFEFESTGQARTTLFFESASNNLIAYAAIKCSSIRVQETNTYASVFPAIEVMMLCVDDRYQRRGIGEAAFSYIINEIYKIKRRVGIRLITLFSLKDSVGFYRKKFNFRQLDKGMEIFCTQSYRNCIPMYLALPKDSTM